MINISGFFQKFFDLQKNSNQKLESVLAAIKKETGVDLPKHAIEIKGDTVKLNCSPVFRNEIFMHRKEIEELLKSEKIFLKLV